MEAEADEGRITKQVTEMLCQKKGKLVQRL